MSRLLDLHSELVICISTYWTDYSLGLPAGSFNRTLRSLPSDPLATAPRVIGKFGSVHVAFAMEVFRIEKGAAERMARILIDKGANLIEAHEDWQLNYHRTTALILTGEYGVIKTTSLRRNKPIRSVQLQSSPACTALPRWRASQPKTRSTPHPAPIADAQAVTPPAPMEAHLNPNHSSACRATRSGCPDRSTADVQPGSESGLQREPDREYAENKKKHTKLNGFFLSSGNLATECGAMASECCEVLFILFMRWFFFIAVALTPIWVLTATLVLVKHEAECTVYPLHSLLIALCASLAAGPYFTVSFLFFSEMHEYSGDVCLAVIMSIFSLFSYGASVVLSAGNVALVILGAVWVSRSDVRCRETAPRLFNATLAMVVYGFVTAPSRPRPSRSNDLGYL
ncbi:hypothetical protein M427DRAFT_32284 [Gonapodya prolifera JEL478]|uniref:Uncharacterized protein n=1 Tax=Gonapodya prolifera (strain JEL478) TaxID=1344416 RepID=A0A139AFX5_GONPJ|nr:hypothetical protein M427DRAFT_32284 [Gonapodya prolifera JEL478]|eukprot:KXS15599.1 hypothetical protein M427DRAFT_32284 [Gonapodya prolifera JEL478]